MQESSQLDPLRSIYRKVRSLGRRLIPQPPPPLLSIPDGQNRVGDFDESDIFVVSYPRSGNNWFQYLIFEIIYGVNIHIAPLKLLQELSIDLNFKQSYTRYRTPCFFKSHNLPLPEYRRVVYLLRDGRDAMVSYFHHIKATNGIEDLDELDVLRNGTYLTYGKWQDHVEQWLENPYQSDMLMIKYRDLMNDPIATLNKFCAFAGVERDTDFIEQAVARTSFSVMQNTEKVAGWAPKDYPKDKHFVRRGKVGSYKDEMSPEVLKEFLLQAGDTLRKVGYEID
ncbi:MAG: sulfotransferase domain-containing protein [Anaerolineae bacterium]